MTHRQYDSTGVASIYVDARPTPSEELIKSIVEQLAKSCKPSDSNGKWSCAVDVGCGSGQATFMLADYFNQVYGFDISQPQINEANERNKYSNVSFRISPGEEIPLENNSVQLITVCEALHFFNIEKFNAKVDSLLVDGGLFVAIAYYPVPKLTRVDDPTVNLDKVGDWIERLFQAWNDKGFPVKVFIDRVKTRYNCLSLPFDRLCHEVTSKTTIRRPATYIFDLYYSLGTAQLFKSKYPKEEEDLMNEFRKDVYEIFGTNDLSLITIEAEFEYFALCFKK